WGGFTPIAIALIIVMMIVVVAFICFVERSERRIPIQSAKRMVGRSMTQASSSFLPLRVNSGGVMPVIFAASILSAPMLLQNVSLWGSGPLRDTKYFGPLFRWLGPAEPLYVLLYIVSIIFFAYFTSQSSSVPTTSRTTCASTEALSLESDLASARPTSSTMC